MIPNIITSVRILLAIPIIFLLYRGNACDFPIAGVLILIATISDGLDGFAARRLNMASLFGAMYDLTADRCIMTPSLLLLAIRGRFVAASGFMPFCPWPYAAIVVIADVTTLIGIAAYLIQRKSKPNLEFPKPPFIVKITYSWQILPVLVAAFLSPTGWLPGWLMAALMYNAVIFTLISFAVYMKKGGFVFDIKK